MSKNGQKKTHSMTEIVLNTASGFVVAYLVWLYIVSPLFDIPYDPIGGLGITTIFTVVSIIRGYVWRRIFNWIMVRQHENGG